MKRVLTAACLVFSAAGLRAQRDPLSSPETFSSLGGTQELRVTLPPNVSWKVRNRPSITTSDTRPPFFQLGEVTSGRGNGTVKVIVPPNTEMAGRSAPLGIEVTPPADAGGNGVTYTTGVTVKQLAFAASPTSLNFLAGGGTKTVTLTADSDWQVTAAATHLTVTPRNGTAGATLSITCPTFPSSLPVRFRAGSVTVSNGAVSRTIAANQSR